MVNDKIWKISVIDKRQIFQFKFGEKKIVNTDAKKIQFAFLCLTFFELN